MLTAIELRQEAGKFLEQAKALADAAEIRGDGLTDDEATKSGELIESHDKNLKRAELMEGLEQRQTAALGVEPNPIAQTPITQPAEERVVYPLGEEIQALALAAGYSELRGKVHQRIERRSDALPKNREFTELRFRPTGGIEKRAPSGMSEGIAADGGFFVGTDSGPGLLTNTFETALLPARARNVPISAGSNGVKFNGINETSRADGSRGGGILSYWEAEAAQKTKSKPEFRQIELNLKKLIGLTWLTDELMQDASALEAIVRQGFIDEFGFKVDDGMINGLGGGMPLGILNSGALVTVTPEVGQPITTLVAENVEKMYSRLFPSSISNAVWHINQSLWPQIFSFSHAVGTGGAPMFIPAGGLTDTPAGTLLGRPIIPIEQCQALGTKGDIYLCDWSHYYLATKGGIQSDSSIHLRFDYDETAIRWVLRLDGQPDAVLPVTPYLGGAGATQSAFITLDGRP